MPTCFITPMSILTDCACCKKYKKEIREKKSNTTKIPIFKLSWVVFATSIIFLKNHPVLYITFWVRGFLNSFVVFVGFGVCVCVRVMFCYFFFFEGGGGLGGSVFNCITLIFSAALFNRNILQKICTCFTHFPKVSLGTSIQTWSIYMVAMSFVLAIATHPFTIQSICSFRACCINKKNYYQHQYGRH